MRLPKDHQLDDLIVVTMVGAYITACFLTALWLLYQLMTQTQW